MNRLYRCRHDRRVAGVAAGLAEYLDVDVTLVRLAWVASIFFGGLGLLAYLVLAIAMPLEPDTGGQSGDASGHRHRQGPDGLWLTVLGFILIACGGVALLDLVSPGAGRYAWPAAIVGLGLALVALSLRHRRDAV